MDISAVIIHKILTEKDIDVYNKLKLAFLHPSYSTVYSIIATYYNKYNKLPGFDDLSIGVRESAASKTIQAIKELEVPDVESEVVLNALIDQYTQNETIDLLEPFITKLPLYEADEIKDKLASIALTIEDKTNTSESIFTMADLLVFQHQEDLDRERIFLQLNSEFDAAIAGIARQEVLFIGGKVGHGKSLVSSNIFINQYLAGRSSIYFSIEMGAYEIHQRHMSMLSGVPLQRIKNNNLRTQDVEKLARTMSEMYENSDSVWEEFLEHKDRFKFEQNLVRNCKLKEDNQMVIIDDRNLSLGAIDLHIGKCKAKFGDKLGVVVVDYINQIAVEEGFSQLDWQPQIEIAKKLKNLARKHEVALVSPFQIDDNGNTRFAKGILDSADIALILSRNEDDSITFESKKMRGAPPIKFTCPINWNTLKISPTSITRETTSDIPWKNDNKE